MKVTGLTPAKGKSARLKRLVRFLALLLAPWSVYLVYTVYTSSYHIVLGSLSGQDVLSASSHRPSIRPIKIVYASQLGATRIPRVVDNQEEYLTWHACPVTGPETTTARQAFPTTLVTQLSVDRFWLVLETCRNRWNPDPMVATIYFASLPELASYSHSIIQQLTQASCHHVHLIFYVDDILVKTPYPINLLRNLALEVVRTSHVLVYDVDFIPSRDLSRHIREAWNVRNAARKATGSNRTLEALVIPTLQISTMTKMHATKDSTFTDAQTNITRTSPNNDHDRWAPLLPSTFDEAILCLNTGICSPFDENYNQAHGSTRTDLWLQRKWYETRQCKPEQSSVLDLRHIPCIDAPAYEPYLVLPWCPMLDKLQASSDHHVHANLTRMVPYYDERFTGYGYNKIQFTLHLRYLGFLLWVVPQGFLTHVPHSPSPSQRAFTASDRQARQGMRTVYDRFRKELDQTFGWKQTNLRTCRHWNKYYANHTLNEAFCETYVSL